MLKAFILTEGGKDIGFGHITRCTSICQAFEEKNIMPRFILNGDKVAKVLLSGRDSKVFNWLKERGRLFNILQEADIIIIDSYLADLEIYKRISEMVRVPVYMDDNGRLDYPRGVILNGSINAKDLYKKNNMVYLLGNEYITLRKEFWEVPEKETKKNLENVIITFGGDDSRNMTPKTLELLAKHYPELNKKVIVGKGFRNLDEIKEVKDERTELIHSPEAEDIKMAFLGSDIAISAGGQTLYELARIGVPAIVIAIAKNQLNNIKGWQDVGFVYYAGWWEDKETLNNLSNSIEDLKDREVRLQKSLIGKRFVDGRGSLRVRDALLEIAGKSKDVHLGVVTRYD